MLLQREDLQKVRAMYEASLAAQKKKILVCAGTGCVAGGALDIHAELIRLLEASGQHCAVLLEKESSRTGIGFDFDMKGYAGFTAFGFFC